MKRIFSILFVFFLGIFSVSDAFASAADFLAGLESVLSSTPTGTGTVTTTSGTTVTPWVTTTGGSVITGNSGVTTGGTGVQVGNTATTTQSTGVTQNNGVTQSGAGWSASSTGTSPVSISTSGNSWFQNTAGVIATSPVNTVSQPVSTQKPKPSNTFESSWVWSAGLLRANLSWEEPDISSLNSAPSEPKCNLPAVKSVYVKQYPSKSTIRWNAVSGSAGYDIFKKGASGNFVFIERIYSPIYTIYLSAGNITYDDFRIAAVCPATKTASAQSSLVTRVKTWSEYFALFFIALCFSAGIFLWLKKKREEKDIFHNVFLR